MNDFQQVGALVGVRKLLDYIFTQFELEYLDDIIPDIVKRKKEDRERKRSIAPLHKSDSLEKVRAILIYVRRVII